jgi:hypothetical protein
MAFLVSMGRRTLRKIKVRSSARDGGVLFIVSVTNQSYTCLKRGKEAGDRGRLWDSNIPCESEKLHHSKLPGDISVHTMTGLLGE